MLVRAEYVSHVISVIHKKPQVKYFLYYTNNDEVNGLPDAQGSGDTNANVNQPGARRMRTIWPISQIIRKFEDYSAKYEHKPPADKAARRTANATVAIAIFMVVLAGVGIITLIEVIVGGFDTAKLAQPAVDQASAMTLQEQRMESVASAGVAQAGAALVAADAAKSAADTAAAALKQSPKAFTVEQRPVPRC
jgi:hypothetical protein